MLLTMGDSEQSHADPVALLVGRVLPSFDSIMTVIVNTPSSDACIESGIQERIMNLRETGELHCVGSVNEEN